LWDFAAVQLVEAWERLFQISVRRQQRVKIAVVPKQLELMEFECWYRLAVVFEQVGTDGLFPWAVLARVQQRPGAVLERLSRKLALFVEQPGVDTLAVERVGTDGLFPWVVVAKVLQRPGAVLERLSQKLAWNRQKLAAVA
jgi:hypothetical protein